MLQDVLRREYQAGGLDAVKAKYRALRERFYGRFNYDFSEVPLADLAGEIWDSGASKDGVELHALNVDMNPGSAFAKRQHASLAITRSFREEGIERGKARSGASRTMARRFLSRLFSKRSAHDFSTPTRSISRLPCSA